MLSKPLTMQKIELDFMILFYICTFNNQNKKLQISTVIVLMIQ